MREDTVKDAVRKKNTAEFHKASTVRYLVEKIEAIKW